MKPTRVSNPFLRAAYLGLSSTIAIAFSAQFAHAATQYWDSTTSANVQPGNGTWGTSSFWTQNGTTLAAWTTGNIAVFAGTGATASSSVNTNAGTDGTAESYVVTVGSGLSASNLYFNNTGYILQAASSQNVALTGTGNGVILVASGKTATIGNNANILLNAASNTGTRIDLTTGGILEIASGGTVSRTGQVTTGFSTTGGTLGFMGSGTVNVAGTLSFNVATPVANGGIVIAANSGNNNILNVNGGTVSSNSTINGIALTAAGGSPALATSGILTINSGLISTTGTAGVTSGINLANGTNTTGTVNLNGGTISTFQINSNYYNGSNVLTTGGTSNFNFNGGTLKAIANNTAFMAGLTAANVKLGGAVVDSNGFNITIGQALLHDSALGATPDGGLTKNGGGILTLSGGNTYTGATSVTAGTLALTGSLTSSISVGNAATLSGTGSTTGSITFNSGSFLTVDPTDELAGNGVSFAGSTTLNFASALSAGNTYDVIDFGSGSLSGTGNIIKTSRGTLATSGTLLQFTAGSVATDTWNTTSGTWQIGTTTPWTNSSDNQFWNGDTVNFDDTPGANASVTLSGALIPAAVTVNNDTVSYTFSGSGSIGGTTSLVKSGSGGLTISTANNYSGGTTLSAGTLNADNASALGTGAVTITGGTLDNTSGSAKTLTTNNVQNWNGNFAFTGSSDLNMGTGNVTIGGTGTRTVSVNAGTLTVGKISSTGQNFTKDGSGTLAITTVAASSIGGTLNVANGTIQFNTGGTTGTTGDLLATGLTGSGTITNGGGVERWLIITNAADSSFAGTLANGAAGALGFSKQGAGIMTLGGSSSYTGTTTVGGGTLVINGANAGTGTNVNLGANTLVLGNTNALGTTSTISATNGATLRIATDGGDTAYATNFGTGTTLNVILDRATAGAGVDHAFGAATYGGGTVNFTSGANVTSGTASASYSSLSLTAGSVQTTLLNPTDTNVSIGSVTIGLNNQVKTLGLGGTSADNEVTGSITNGVGTVSVSKSNTSIWTLSGASSYTGATTVSAGTLLINGSLGNTAVSVTAGTLGGSGSISGTVSVTGTGTLAAGTSPESLKTGALTMGTGSTFAYEAANATSTGADLVAVAGALSLTGVNLDLSGANLGGGFWNLEDKLTLISYVDGGAGISSGFTGYDDGASYVFGGNEWRFDYNDTAAGGNFATDATANSQNYFVTMTVVPEPDAVLLGGIGMLMLLRRKRS